MVSVSIIVPIYNLENHLANCLQSLTEQCWADFEIICVDDGSTDNSMEVLKTWAEKDARIKVYHQHNQGVSVARNRGIKEACGEYICFVDGDDEVTYNYLQRFMEEEKSSGADVVVSDFVYVEMNRKDASRGYLRLVSKGLQAMTPEVLSQCSTSPWNKLYKTSIIRQYQVEFPPGIAFGEDNVFIWRYFMHCDTVQFIPDCTYRYIQRFSSAAMTVTHDARRKTMNLIAGAELILHDLVSYNKIEPYGAAYLDFFAQKYRMAYKFAPIQYRKNIMDRSRVVTEIEGFPELSKATSPRARRIIGKLQRGKSPIIGELWHNLWRKVSGK